MRPNRDRLTGGQAAADEEEEEAISHTCTAAFSFWPHRHYKSPAQRRGPMYCLYTQSSFRGGAPWTARTAGWRRPQKRGRGYRVITTGHISATRLAKNDASLPEWKAPLSPTLWPSSVSPACGDSRHAFGMGSGTASGLCSAPARSFASPPKERYTRHPHDA